MARQMKDSGIEWIGEIPEGWETKRLKYASTFMQTKYADSYGALPYVGLENIVSWNGSYVKTDSQYDREQSLICEPNDILFGKLRPYLAKVYMNPVLQCCSGEFAVIRIAEQNKRYMWYQLLSHGFIFTVDRSTYGTKMPRANADFIKNIPVAIPPLTEQHRIAAFLDRKCAEIDAVIERTKATIEEYKKLKQAVITEAVTKGVRGARKMKDSGAQWIGSVPEDWMVYRIANLYDERSEEGLDELPILTVSINTGVSDHEVADEDKDRVFIRIEDRTKYKRVYPGDLTYNMMRAWQGAFGAVRVHGMVSPAYVIAKPKAAVKLDSRYMEALLRTKQATEEMHRYSRGIVDFRLRLYWEEFKNIRVCLPSFEEQMEIADYIDEKCAAMDALIAKKTALLTELETYKKSLIYEYVTGKKEVV